MPQDIVVTCVECGAEFPLATALRAKIEEAAKAEAQSEKNKAIEQGIKAAMRPMQEQLAIAQQKANEAADGQQKALQEKMKADARIQNMELEVTKRVAAELDKRVNDAVKETEEKHKDEKRILKQDAQKAAQKQERERWEAKAEKQRQELAQSEAAMQKLREEKDAVEAAITPMRAQLDAAKSAEKKALEEKMAADTRARNMEAEITKKVASQLDERVADALQQENKKHQAEKAMLLSDKKRSEQQARDEEAAKYRKEIEEGNSRVKKLQSDLENAQRRATQMAQPQQGDILEEEVLSALEGAFPLDTISRTPKGVSGADVMQTVRNNHGHACGIILWEVKNTKAWQKSWTGKLKTDQQNKKADIAVIVSDALPKDLGAAQLGLVDNGILAVGRDNYVPLAALLRNKLLEIEVARGQSANKGEKMEVLYKYLTGNEFRLRVDTLLRAFEDMRGEVERERRFMLKQWAAREKRLEHAIGGIAGMHGDLVGIVGEKALHGNALLDDMSDGDEGNSEE